MSFPLTSFYSIVDKDSTHFITLLPSEKWVLKSLPASPAYRQAGELITPNFSYPALLSLLARPSK